MQRCLNLLIVLLLAISSHTRAAVYVENPDASAFRSSAQEVPDGTTSISGDIRNVGLDSDVDLYQFRLYSGGPFTIEVLTEDAALDMNLLVFNASGQFLAGDDDDDSDCTPINGLAAELDSCLTLNLDAGIYYFAVGDNNIGAYTTEQEYLSGEADFYDNDSGILDSPSTEIMFMVGDESGRRSDADDLNDEGSYRVNFSEAVYGFVPIIDAMPIWMIAVLAGFIGLLGRQRLLKQSG